MIPILCVIISFMRYSRENTYLCVPEMRRQVIALLPELDRDDFVHVEYFLTTG